MTRAQDIRREVLFQLYAAGISVAKEPAQLARVANRDAGFDAMTADEARDACLFHCDAGLVEKVVKTDGSTWFRIRRDGILTWEANQ